MPQNSMTIKNWSEAETSLKKRHFHERNEITTQAGQQW